MICQWTGPAVLTRTLLPAGVVPLTGRAPHRLRARPAPTRPPGRAFLTRYAVAPVDAVPRPADVPHAVTPAATALGRASAVAGRTVVSLTARRARAAAR